MDRGHYSLETVSLLLAFKARWAILVAARPPLIPVQIPR